jgi:hypothetical protein
VINSGPREFRTVGKRDWELVDSSIGDIDRSRSIPLAMSMPTSRGSMAT